MNNDFLSNFSGATQTVQDFLVNDAGRTCQTSEIRNQLKIALKKKVETFYDQFNLVELTKKVHTKAVYGKTISKEAIIAILRSTEANNKLAINDFDCILIAYSRIPIALFVNKGKIEQKKNSKINLKAENDAPEHGWTTFIPQV